MPSLGSRQWRGDSQTGAYGEAVFREVSAHNQTYYAAFSTLLRESFDDARKRFGDSSIDLLHIDGLHTYQAVRHDFENWLPKVSPGGMVLFHDTQIRYGDFGVWGLWQELRSGYDSFEFVHSCGLGVIRKPGGAGTLAGLAGLLFGDRETEGVRRFYRVCGERLEYKDRLERQPTHGKWGILVKLYWREGGQKFSEERSTLTCATKWPFPRRESEWNCRVALLSNSFDSICSRVLHSCDCMPSDCWGSTAHYCGRRL